ncbi:MAG: YdeI/OmpD-associated family protein [Rhodoglobus sp.]
MSVTFRTTLIRNEGSTATGISVPENVMAELGPGKRYPVLVTIGKYTYRNTVGWYKGAFMIGVSAENRAGAGVEGGDVVDVTLELDNTPRTLDLPDGLIVQLKAAGVLEKFTGLSFSRQRGLVDPWVAAKTDATREKNLAKMIEAAS